MASPLELATASDSLPTPENTEGSRGQQPGRSKRERFHFVLAFTALSVVAFTSALDATILAIALPVRWSLPFWRLLLTISFTIS